MSECPQTHYADRQGPVRARAPRWWLAGGIAAADCLAAYQAKGAASLAASYDNLAAPGNGLADGTYDLTLGIAPAWAAGTGWTFNGLTQYLITGIIEDMSQTWSMAVMFSGAQAALNCVMGAYDDAGGLAVLMISPSDGAGNVFYQTGMVAATRAPNLVAGWLGIGGRQPYRNGVADGALIGAGLGSTQTQDLYIGGMNYNGGYVQGTQATIVAAAVYTVTWTAPQALALFTAMAAL